MTVTLRKLSREEATRTFTRRGQMDVAEYVAALRALQVGDSAELELGGLTIRAAKRRLGIAATHVGYRLMYFQVLPPVTSPARTGRRQRTRPQARQPEMPTPVTSNPPAAEMAATSTSAPPRARRRRVARSN